MTDPDLPSDIDIEDLDPSVLQDLRSLSKENMEAVAKHLIMAGTWMDDDPKLALRHARAAKDRAGRVAVAREANGIAAYRAGEWKEALSELRAARRISGGLASWRSWLTANAVLAVLKRPLNLVVVKRLASWTQTPLSSLLSSSPVPVLTWGSRSRQS